MILGMVITLYFFLTILIGIEHFVSQTNLIARTVLLVLEQEAQGKNEYLPFLEIVSRTRQKIPDLPSFEYRVRESLSELFCEQRALQCSDFHFGGALTDKRFRLV